MSLSVDDEDTLDSVTDHWLPFIRRTLGETHKTPVILVGNKVDLVDYSTMEAVLPIMNEYEEIETCVECSARNLKNISEMFYFSQKAVLHPSAPVCQAFFVEYGNVLYVPSPQVSCLFHFQLWNYNDKDVRKTITKIQVSML